MHNNDNNPELYDEQLGQNIRAARLLQGFTQEQLADAVGISHQHMQRHEAGQHRLTVSRLKQIAQTLGVKATDLLPDTPDQTGTAISPQTLQLVAAIRDLPHDKVRDDIARLVRTINTVWPRSTPTR